MMSHAYAIEVLLLLLSSATLSLVLWAQHDLLVDQFAAKLNGLDAQVMALWKVRVNGIFVALAVLLLAGAIWVVAEAPPDQSGRFWHAEQLIPARIHLTLINVGHLMAALAARILVWRTREA